MNQITHSKRAMIVMLLFVTLVSATFVAARPADAYVCTVTSFVPYNSGVKITAKGTASCPASTQYKTLKTSLVRLVTFLPDQTVISASQSGSLTSYSKTATGCNISGSSNGYKTVVNFTGQGNFTSSTTSLTCTK